MARVDPTLAALRAHEVPGWWRAAKLGIFVHWTPASVAGFAPAHGDYGELLTSGRRDAFSYSPYTEWYQNSLRFPGSPVARHHAEVWGDRPYEAFVTDFEAGRLTGVFLGLRGRPDHRICMDPIVPPDPRATS